MSPLYKERIVQVSSYTCEGCANWQGVCTLGHKTTSEIEPCDDYCDFGYL